MKKRKSNPSPAEFERAAKLYRDFTGHKPVVIGKIRAPKMPKVMTRIGRVAFIGYDTVRDGVPEKYIHKFAKGDAPTLCVSPDGKTIFLIGGNYTFTERGIVDRTDRK